MRKGDAIEALRAQRRATLDQLAGLEREVWDAPCLPSWCVRDVVAHLATIDTAAVAGRLLPLLRSPDGRAAVERWNDNVVRQVDTDEPEALLAELDRAGQRLRAVAERVPAVAWRAPFRTVFGRHPLGFLVARRVLDEWVHTVDIARAAGSIEPRAVAVPDWLATAVLDALPVQVLPRLDLPVGVVRLVVLTAPPGEDGEHAPRRTWSVDFARRHFGPRVTAPPDATIRLHAGALALLGEGRDPGGYGPVALEGDEALAARVLAGLPPA